MGRLGNGLRIVTDTAVAEAVPAPMPHRAMLRMPSTRPPLRRIAWTLSQLRAGNKLTAPAVAEKFGVGVRTVYRDLDFLRDEWRVPFEYDRAAGSHRLTEPTSALPPVTMSQGEVVALFFAEKVLAQYRGTPFESDLESAFRKIQTLLSEEVRVLPDKLLGYLSLDLGPLPPGEPRTFSTVVDALVQRRRLRVRYRSHSSGATLERLLEPYRIFNLSGCWYTAAFDHRRRSVRDFALHRIRGATLTAERYEIDPRFDFKKYMADAFRIEKGERSVNVAIRFAARQARWIRERPWHRSARVQERLDGGCVLRMKVAATSELRRWVMQFGKEAEVLAPRSFRNTIAEELRAAGRVYGGAARPRLA